MILLPPLDRRPADHRNLTCKIVRIEPNDQFKGTKHGQLKGTYSRNNFETCKSCIWRHDACKLKNIIFFLFYNL